MNAIKLIYVERLKRTYLWLNAGKVEELMLLTWRLIHFRDVSWLFTLDSTRLFVRRVINVRLMPPSSAVRNIRIPQSTRLRFGIFSGNTRVKDTWRCMGGELGCKQMGAATFPCISIHGRSLCLCALYLYYLANLEVPCIFSHSYKLEKKASCSIKPFLFCCILWISLYFKSKRKPSLATGFVHFIPFRQHESEINLKWYIAHKLYR